MATISLASLLVRSTASIVYGKLIDIATGLGLETESWFPGDPTRTLFDAVSRLFGQTDGYEDQLHDSIAGGFLDLATGRWLTLLAYHGFNVERRTATYGTCVVRLTNGAAAIQAFDADDITVRNPVTEATYRNTTGGSLGGNGTLDLEFLAETAGSEGTSAINEITELVTSYSNVTVTNITAAVGSDEETDDQLRARCRAKLQSLSPAGAKGAYHYVSTTSELNGGANVTRTRVVGDTTLGRVTVYLANDAGGVSSGDRDLVEEALETHANPLVADLTVLAATDFSQAVTYELWVYSDISKTTHELEESIEDALLAEFTRIAIGGDVIPPATSGFLYAGRIQACILQAVSPYGFKCTLTTPAGDTALTIGQVPTLGVVTATIHLVQR